MDRLRSRRVRIAVWLFAGVFFVWALVRLFGLEAGYPMVALIALTPYAGMASVLPLVAAVTVRDWGAIAFAALTCALFAIVLLPRAFSGPSAGDSEGAHLRVLTLNYELATEDARQLAAQIKDLDVDVLALQQVPDGGASIAAAGINRLLPHRLSEPGATSMVLSSIRPSGEVDAEGPYPGARLQVGGTSLELWAIHAVDPTSPDKASEWSDDLAAVPRASEEQLRVALGDFNATLDHAALRDVLDTGYTDAADAAGAGLSPTFPAHDLWPPPVTVDHVLVDERIGVADVQNLTLSHADHRAVYADLTLPSTARPDG
jgi:endonuclease/exonuclease/phosphatase family metal-dependent hydrolase